MQELHHWVATELKLDGYEHGVILDKIESMLEKEKDQIKSAFTQGELFAPDYFDGKNIEAENYYNETFNTKQK